MLISYCSNTIHVYTFWNENDKYNIKCDIFVKFGHVIMGILVITAKWEWYRSVPTIVHVHIYPDTC